MRFKSFLIGAIVGAAAVFLLYYQEGVVKEKGNKISYLKNRKLLNMANTVSPIIQQISEKLGEYENCQITAIDNLAWSKGGSLIYKREPISSCVGGVGNAYYIRVYLWEWIDGKLWHKPTHDVSLGCYSCIPEEDVLIPHWDEKLQNAELGKKYLVVGRKS